MTNLTIADLATELNSDPRTVRKFMRAVTPRDAQPGKGSRWEIAKKDLRSLRAKFAKFEEAVAAKRESKDASNDDDTIEVSSED